jgi:DNA modification methylase
LGYLTDTQKRAYIIADNKIALNAGWDAEMLALEFADLKLEGFDFDLLGFDDDELLEFMPVEKPEPLTDEDVVPDVPVVPVTKLGDVWLCGNHRVMCGDSTSVNAVDKLMNGKKADMVFTDPPYGIGIDGQKESTSKNPKHNRKAHEFKGWDKSRPEKKLFDFLISMNVPVIIFGGNYFADLLPPSRGWIVWNKGQDGCLTMSDGELAWTNIEKPLRSITVNRAEIGKSVHPTQKPIKVIEFCIDYAGIHNLIIDLFGGSGSTLIACEKTNRINYSMELDEKYCDVIVKRWQEFTGKQATLESTGKTFNDSQR